jgi:hypothetical protein
VSLLIRNYLSLLAFFIIMVERGGSANLYIHCDLYHALPSLCGVFLSFLFLVGCCGGWFSKLHIAFCFELYFFVITVYCSTT